MPPSDMRVEYFMIKRAIILHGSRPRLRPRGGGQITVQSPVPNNTTRRGTQLGPRGLREGQSNLG